MICRCSTPAVHCHVCCACFGAKVTTEYTLPQRYRQQVSSSSCPLAGFARHLPGTVRLHLE